MKDEGGMMAGFMRAYMEKNQEAGKPLRFVAATEGVKRDGLDLKMEGARLDNFRANPVVTWVHDLMGRNLPVGRAEVWAEGGRLMTEIQFDGEDGFAREIERKYRNGFLHTVSISWNPIRTVGREVVEWELLEIAAVPVPGDPQALIQRQLRALQALSEDAETEWRETAQEMTALFAHVDDADEAERMRRYRRLETKYRKLGRTAPEYLSGAVCKALGDEELRGLFFEGEEFEGRMPCAPTDAQEEGGEETENDEAKILLLRVMNHLEGMRDG